MGNVLFYYKIENRWNGNNTTPEYFFLKVFFKGWISSGKLRGFGNEYEL